MKFPPQHVDATVMATDPDARTEAVDRAGTVVVCHPVPLNRQFVVAGARRAGFTAVRGIADVRDVPLAVEALDPVAVFVEVGNRAGAVTLTDLERVVGSHRLVVMSAAPTVIDLALGLGLLAIPSATATVPDGIAKVIRLMEIARIAPARTPAPTPSATARHLVAVA